jgi:hypothetical protein
VDGTSAQDPARACTVLQAPPEALLSIALFELTGLPIGPCQDRGESNENGNDRNGHEQRVGRHNVPPSMFWGIIFREPVSRL